MTTRREHDSLGEKDVPADALSDVQWDAVSRLVRERGGSLFLVAGPDHLPASYTPARWVHFPASAGVSDSRFTCGALTVSV